MGSRHALNASSYSEVGVYDINSEITANFSRVHNLKGFFNLDDAWKWLPDGVIIAIPNQLHVQYAIKSIENNVKFILVEKPISNSLDEAKKLIHLANEYKSSIFVVSNMRYSDAVQTIKKNVFRVGKPLYIRAHVGNYLPNMRPNVDYRTVYAAIKKQGGGVLLDAIHEIDYLCWLFGRVKSIIAVKATLSNLEIDVEDFSSIMIEHQSGLRTLVTMDYIQQCKRRGCEIVGSEGTLIWNSEGKNPENCLIKIFEKSSKQWQILFESNSIDLSLSYIELVKDFIAAINQKHHNLATAKEAFDALNVVISSHKSSDFGKKINL